MRFCLMGLGAICESGDELVDNSIDAWAVRVAVLVLALMLVRFVGARVRDGR